MAWPKFGIGPTGKKNRTGVQLRPLACRGGPEGRGSGERVVTIAIRPVVAVQPVVMATTRSKRRNRMGAGDIA
jgi:hypothetical protein